MFIPRYLVMVAMLTGALHPEGDTTPQALKDFSAHVQAYWDLHKKIASAAPPMDKKKETDPAVIIEHQRQLAAGIRDARPKAAEGDIFTPVVQKIFIPALNKDLSTSKRGAEARGMILGEGNPKSPESAARVVLAVNGVYPASAPLSTVPPSVLMRLPKLPDGLEYRFVGRHLILFDEKANIIVDILRNAIR